MESRKGNMNEDHDIQKKNRIRCKRSIFHYLKWGHLIAAFGFALVACLSLRITTRIDEYNLKPEIGYTLGGLCILFMFISCIFFILFQKQSFASAPEDRSEIGDERDRNYEERQRKNSRKKR